MADSEDIKIQEETFKAKVSKAYRVTIPLLYREALDLKIGDKLEVTVRKGDKL